jgi:hypothetical protein
MFCADPWLYDVLSTGWKLVSFLLSKPVPNSICGTLQEPKFPMLVEAAGDPQEPVEVLEEPVADALGEDVEEVVVLDAVPPTIFPWSSTSGTAVKSVFMPNTALKASAWAPVFAVLESAAVFAVAQVFFAV